MITQTQVLTSRQWIQDLKNGRACDIVIGSDNDGWLSGLFLTNLGATVCGIYNNRELAVSNECERNKLKYIDTDIAIPSITSCGHHITSYSNKNTAMPLYNLQGIQINEMYGVTFKNTSELTKRFSYKYPLSTILYLLWLFEFDITMLTTKQKNYILQADGVLNNAVNYCHSVKHWIENMFPNLREMFTTDSNNLLDYYKHSIDYRQMRKESIVSEFNGQGKGIEKGKVLEVDGSGTLILKQRDYIKNYGRDVGFSYIPEKWKCWDNMSLYKFEPQVCKTSIVSEFRKVINSPHTLVSLVFSNSAGYISYTTAKKSVIRAAFGI